MRTKNFARLLILALLGSNLVFASEIYIDLFTIFVDQKDNLKLHVSKKDIKIPAYAIEDSIKIVYKENFYNLILLNELLCKEDDVFDRNTVLPSDLVTQMNYNLLSHALGMKTDPTIEDMILAENKNVIKTLEEEENELKNYKQRENAIKNKYEGKYVYELNNKNLLIQLEARIKKSLTDQLGINSSNLINIIKSKVLGQELYNFISKYACSEIIKKCIKKINMRKNYNYNRNMNAN